MSAETGSKVLGYTSEDRPLWGQTLRLGSQQVLTMFPATVLVAVLTKFDVGVTLLASGLGAIDGYLVAIPLGLIDFTGLASAAWIQMPNITLPGFGDERAWAVIASAALIAIATIPESTAHLYQMSLYIDQLAKDLGRAPSRLRKNINRVRASTPDPSPLRPRGFIAPRFLQGEGALQTWRPLSATNLHG